MFLETILTNNSFEAYGIPPRHYHLLILIGKVRLKEVK